MAWRLEMRKECLRIGAGAPFPSPTLPFPPQSSVLGPLPPLPPLPPRSPRAEDGAVLERRWGVVLEVEVGREREKVGGELGCGVGGVGAGHDDRESPRACGGDEDRGVDGRHGDEVDRD
jgi:hypothetical protein